MIKLRAYPLRNGALRALLWTGWIAGGIALAQPLDFYEAPLLDGRQCGEGSTNYNCYNNPEVNAIIHTHAPYASALAATGTALKTIHMDSAMLYGCAHLAEWPGVPVADDEGRIISAALGKAKTILLANHGLLTTGTYVEEAAYLAVFFERAARMQLRAMAAGGVKEVKPELAAEAREFLLQPAIVRGTFAYWARRLSS